MDEGSLLFKHKGDETVILGIVCIGYYILIGLYLGRFNSKFPRIWLLLGGGSILASRQVGLIQEGIREKFLPLCVLVFVFFIGIELLILFGMQKRKDAGIAEYVIVLGAKVDGWNLTDALRQRLDKAREYVNCHPDTKIIVSGGQGEGENMTEAQAMANYLIKCGIDKEQIFKEEQSTTTRENLIYSGIVMLENEGHDKLCDTTVGIVTNDFHMYRAVKIAKQVGFGRITALPAATNPIMLVNYMVREFFGVLKMWAERKRIK